MRYFPPCVLRTKMMVQIMAAFKFVISHNQVNGNPKEVKLKSEFMVLLFLGGSIDYRDQCPLITLEINR